MFNATIDGELGARLDAFASQLDRALQNKAAQLANELVDYIRDEKLSGQVLQSRSGALRDSIVAAVTAGGGMASASVGSAGDVKYAAIQEYGGRTSAHEILPTKASALAFVAGGGTIFAKRVEHPGSLIPERSYLRSSLADKSAAIIAAFAATPLATWSRG